MFSDNFAVASLIRDGDERAYRELTKDLADFCQRNRRHRHTCTQVNIQERDIVWVTSYKYLGVQLNNKLDETDHTVTIYKKGQTPLAEETQVLWSAGGTPDNFL